MCPPVKIAPIAGGFLLVKNRVLCNYNTRFHMVSVFVIPYPQRPESVFDSSLKHCVNVGIYFFAEYHINPYGIPFTSIIFSGNGGCIIAIVSSGFCLCRVPPDGHFPGHICPFGGIRGSGAVLAVVCSAVVIVSVCHDISFLAVLRLIRCANH